MTSIHSFPIKIGYFSGLAVCILLLTFSAQSAQCENASSYEPSHTVPFACPQVDTPNHGFFSKQYTCRHTYEPFPRHLPALVQSIKLPLHLSKVITAVSLANQYERETHTAVIQPEFMATRENPPLRIESFLQIFDNEKNPFSSNRILLIRDAPFLRSYVSIYIYIYTDFDEIDTLESLKNIGMIVPKLNLTVRMAI